MLKAAAIAIHRCPGESGRDIARVGCHGDSFRRLKVPGGEHAISRFHGLLLCTTRVRLTG
jgi:hypothetical protein